MYFHFFFLLYFYFYICFMPLFIISEFWSSVADILFPPVQNFNFFCSTISFRVFLSIVSSTSILHIHLVSSFINCLRVPNHFRAHASNMIFLFLHLLFPYSLYNKTPTHIKCLLFSPFPLFSTGLKRLQHWWDYHALQVSNFSKIRPVSSQSTQATHHPCPLSEPM